MMPSRSRRRAKTATAAVLTASAGALILLASCDNLFGTGRSSVRRILSQKLSPSSSIEPRKKAALVRPFGPNNGLDLLRSFDLWDTYWPCGSRRIIGGGGEYSVDLILSFSRTLEDGTKYPEASESIERIKSKFESARGGWDGCISDVRVIQVDVPADRDRYVRADEQTDPLWVNGPNEQFRRSMRRVAEMTRIDEDGRDVREYEVAIVMEPDTKPRRPGWMDELLEDVVEKGPFAILGSKFKGHSWDNIKDVMPKSLLEHINGNAAYNLTHPLMKDILDELDLEKDTFFNAIPYDYRISQMITEGSMGTAPEFPFPLMKDRNGNAPIVLPRNAEKFRAWWQRWGAEEPLKESAAIANFATTNYLPEQLGGEAIVHGENMFKPWDPKMHKISLVVSDWSDGLSKTLLSVLDESVHPFSELVVMAPADLSYKEETDEPRSPKSFPESFIAGLERLIGRSSSSPAETKPTTSVPVHYVNRTSWDFMDLCDSPVETEWFFLVNAYHHVAPDVSLMFTDERPSRPIIPYTPADTSHCSDYDACRETMRLARAIFPDLDKVVLDTNMLYHTASRNAFCKSWRDENGFRGELLAQKEGGRAAHTTRSVPLGPTATAYVAYLYQRGMADNFYSFANTLIHGTKDSFVKAHGEIEEERRRIEEEEIGRYMRGVQRKLPPSCTNEGAKTRACGATKGRKQACCENLVCDFDSGECVQQPASYGGGTSARRGLMLSAPGLLVEG